MWEEVGCPSSGVLFNIKRSAKSRYKYAVRRLKRRLQNNSFARKRFWSDVSRLNNSSGSNCVLFWTVSVVVEINIANMLVSKFGGFLNKHSSSSQDRGTYAHNRSVIIDRRST